jgi:hypothetical protein
MSRVAILGCGPAGLLAALAVERAGYEPVIYSLKVKSPMPGAIFLHEPIPGATSPVPDTEIHFLKKGTSAGYGAKVYGDTGAPTSWHAYEEGPRVGWNLVAAYDLLWERFYDRVKHQTITPGFITRLLGGQIGKQKPAMVMSTIPAPAICCEERHSFISKPIWIRTEHLKDSGGIPNRVVYSGEPTDAWYRYSMLFGQESWEFGYCVPKASRGVKPLRTDCDCWKDSVIRLGRFGKWERGVLVHHAYEEALDAVQSL